VLVELAAASGGGKTRRRHMSRYHDSSVSLVPVAEVLNRRRLVGDSRRAGAASHVEGNRRIVVYEDVVLMCVAI
jgi:hypothetical protein